MAIIEGYNASTIKKALDKIKNSLSVKNGGTGHNNFEKNAILIGNNSQSIDSISVENKQGFLYYNNSNWDIINLNTEEEVETPVIPISQGGTGAIDANTARINLGLGNVATEDIVPVSKGGLGNNNSNLTQGSILYKDINNFNVISPPQEENKILSYDIINQQPTWITQEIPEFNYNVGYEECTLIPEYTVSEYPDYNKITFRRYDNGVVVADIKCWHLPATQNNSAIIYENIPYKYRPAQRIYRNAMAYNYGETTSYILDDKLIQPANMPAGLFDTITYQAKDTINQDKSHYILPTYYKNSVEQACNLINNLDNNWTSSIICTDAHANDNQYGSQSIIRYLLENSKCERCFLLGDYCEDRINNYELQSYLNVLLPVKDKIFIAIGNHDVSYDVWPGGATVNYDNSIYDYLYDNFISNKNIYMNTLLANNHKNFYYYFDDNNKKIRYIILNTTDGSSNGEIQISVAQAIWLENKVSELNNDWHILVLAHANTHYSDKGTTGGLGGESQRRISVALSQSQAKIIGYFCGHQHIDLISPYNNTITALNNNNNSVKAAQFYETIFLSDRLSDNETDWYTDYLPQPSRQIGNSNDQSVTIASINTTTGEVKFTRIGARPKYVGQVMQINNLNLYQYGYNFKNTNPNIVNKSYSNKTWVELAP